MNYKWLLEKISKRVQKDDLNHLFLSYNSLIEEVIKICLYRLKNDEPLIIIKENGYLATHFYEMLAPYFDEDEIILYLPEESLRAEAIVASYENRAHRLLALYKTITKKAKVIVTSPYGYIRHLPLKEELFSHIKTINVDEELDRDELIQFLKRAGYEKTSRIDAPLNYSVRGSIVDVYSVNYDKPIRIEFFDDVVESIRTFDINTQRTIEELNEVTIIFAKDVFFNAEEKTVLHNELDGYSGEVELDLEFIDQDVFEPNQYFYYAYFQKPHLKDYVENATLYLSDESRILEHLHLLQDESIAYIQEMASLKRLPLRFYVYGDFHHLCRDINILKGEAFKEVFAPIVEVDLPYGSLDHLLKIILKRKKNKILIALEGKEFEEVVNYLLKEEEPYHIVDEELYDGINLLYAPLMGGFECDDLEVYSSKELFKTRKRPGRFATKYEEATILNSYEELKKGDYVVHDQYGIGQFIKIETREVNGVLMDYLKIAYRGNDELLVPLSQFSLVRKYVSKDGVVPKLHKLGSKEWQTTKAKVQESVNDLAERLVSLYALREQKVGFAFSEDNDLQKEFESEFIYDLTKDQQRAIEEVKADMQSEKPMDRLLCGDVGFGKTEVAIRASFKAVLDHKQVAYLCPTTILSIQHFKTFQERFKNYPVKIALLNRYVLPKDQKLILEEVKSGKVDILIGTHRLLSNDVTFSDLGLLIVDEEQRFGVEHKEKIKEIKNNIDVLSLSATPIPRTLQMSLIGIRGLSTLDTPPKNRYPVQTYVVNKSMGLIKEVIMRELERSGQVFYLYNNIEEIFRLAHKIQKEVPYASVDVAHGQMSREEIEDVMMRFYEGKTNVLICTTIIETGIDIPNANTIIIENAQNFGLSQLYQIKGRVGRSDKIAYAYLLIPQNKELLEKSAKRLEAIKEFTALGSGYKIAMRDLSIRGAGDLLGPKQSGFIDNVGLDLYLMMLHEAIAIQKGEVIKEEKVKTNVPYQSYIPEGFSENDYDKLHLYHALDAISTKEELFEYYIQVQDEYGKLPKEVKALFDKKRLELLINLNDIESVKIIGKDFKVTLTKEKSDRIDGIKLFEYCSTLSRDINIRYSKDKLEFTILNQKENIPKMMQLVDHLDEVMKDEN